MSDVLTLARAALVLALLWYPGSRALARLAPALWSELDATRRWVYALPISTLLLGLAALPLLATAELHSVYPALALIAALGSARDLLSTLRRDPFRLLGLAPIVFVLGYAALTLSASALPGPLSLGYGDLPSYYRIIDNWLSGTRPLRDFWIGDYPGGAYKIPLSFPTTTAAAVTLRSALPSTPHALTLLAACSGGMAAALGVESLCSRMATGRVYGTLTRWLLSGLVLGSFDYAQHLTLGAVIMPVVATLLILVDLALRAVPAKLELCGFVAVTVLVMMSARPEGFVLGGTLAVLYTAKALCEHARARMWVWLFAAVSLAGGVLCLIHAPASIKQSWTPYYLAHDAATGTFELNTPRGELVPSAPWYLLNIDHARENLGLQRQHTAPNPHVFQEVWEHPIDFCSWWLRQVWAQLEPLNASFLALAVAILGWARHRNATWLIAWFALAFGAMAAINFSFHIRHVLPICLGAVVSAGAVLVHQRPRFGWAATAVLGVVLWNAGASAMQRAHTARVADRSALYASVFEAMAGSLVPGSTVASTYPQMFAYGLGVPTIGSSDLYDVLQTTVDLHKPTYVVVDNVRADRSYAYSLIMHRIRREGFQLRDYTLIHDRPDPGFAIFERNADNATAAVHAR